MQQNRFKYSLRKTRSSAIRNLSVNRPIQRESQSNRLARQQQKEEKAIRTVKPGAASQLADVEVQDA